MAFYKFCLNFYQHTHIFQQSSLTQEKYNLYLSLLIESNQLEEVEIKKEDWFKFVTDNSNVPLPNSQPNINNMQNTLNNLLKINYLQCCVYFYDLKQQYKNSKMNLNDFSILQDIKWKLNTHPNKNQNICTQEEWVKVRPSPPRKTSMPHLPTTINNILYVFTKFFSKHEGYMLAIKKRKRKTSS